MLNNRPVSNDQDVNVIIIHVKTIIRLSGVYCEGRTLPSYTSFTLVTSWHSSVTVPDNVSICQQCTSTYSSVF